MKTNMKTIVQCTTDGEFIAAFDSSTEASVETGIPYSTVRYSVRGIGMKDYKFIQQNRAAMHNATRSKMRITKRDQNDKVVAVYANLETASEMTGLSVASIRSVLNNSMTLNGYSFNG